ncbi:MAG: ATP-binding protein [Planctomycetota bacterium]
MRLATDAPDPAEAVALVVVDAGSVPPDAIARWRRPTSLVPWIAVAPPGRKAPEPCGATGCLGGDEDPARPGGVLARFLAAILEVPEIGRYLLRLDEDEVALAFHPRPGVNATLVRFLLRDLALRHAGRRLPDTEVQLALHEALANALEHGNLGITYEEKSAAMETSGGVRALVDERLGDERLAARMAHVRVLYSADDVAYVVRDEGSGFDAHCRSHEPMAAATALHGRGLKLIQHVMDEVQWNPAGTEITMGKRLDRPGVLDDDEDDEDDDDEDDRDLDDDRVPRVRGTA